MASWKSFREDLKAISILLALVVGIAGGIWLLNLGAPLPETKCACPYCGKVIKVELGKNGEKR